MRNLPNGLLNVIDETRRWMKERWCVLANFMKVNQIYHYESCSLADLIQSYSAG